MIETSARLLKLLTLLQSPRDWTGAELAQKLEVTPRTVRTDIERLRALGYPVDATRGSVGGYRLGAGGDAAAAVAGRRRGGGRRCRPPQGCGRGGRRGDVAAGADQAGAGAAVEAAQAGRCTRELHRAGPAGRRGSTGRSGAAHPVGRALPGQGAVAVPLTRAHGGESTLRRVEPHRLVNWGRRWYLVAFDLEKQDWRTFRVVHRVQPRIPTGPRFGPRELPEDGDVAAYVSRRVSAAAWRYQASVVVQRSAADLAAHLTPAAGTGRAAGRIQLRLRDGR